MARSAFPACGADARGRCEPTCCWFGTSAAYNNHNRMLLISIQPYASRKIFVLVLALLGLSSAACFADSIFMLLRSTPHHREVAGIREAVSEDRTDAPLQAIGALPKPSTADGGIAICGSPIHSCMGGAAFRFEGGGTLRGSNRLIPWLTPELAELETSSLSLPALL
jgi:hypothetical protein